MKTQITLTLDMTDDNDAAIDGALRQIVGTIALTLGRGLVALVWFDRHRSANVGVVAGCNCDLCREGLSVGLRHIATDLDAGDPQPAVH